MVTPNSHGAEHTNFLLQIQPLPFQGEISERDPDGSLQTLNLPFMFFTDTQQNRILHIPCLYLCKGISSDLLVFNIFHDFVFTDPHRD